MLLAHKSAPWTAGAGSVLGHHPQKGADVGKSGGHPVEVGKKKHVDTHLIETLNKAFSEKLGNKEGKVLENSSVKQGRATAKEILFITINVISLLFM